MREVVATVFASVLTLVAACGGHAAIGTEGICFCSEDIEPPLANPEGGQIVFEYITYDTELQNSFNLPSGVTTATRVTAFFLDSQTPQDNPLPTPGVCNNLVATKGWPIHIGTPRTELDVGTLDIRGVNTAGIARTISVANQPSGIDAFGRMQDLYYQVTDPNAPDFTKPDSSYTVNFGGAGAIASTSFNDGILLPNTFTVISPDVENNGPLVAGTDFTVNWTPSTTTSLAPSDNVLGVTWLADINGAPTHMCPTLQSAGTFTIPGSSIAEYRQIALSRGLAANKLILRRDAIVHHIKLLPNGEPNNQRRIDMLGIVSWQQLMDVQ